MFPILISTGVPTDLQLVDMHDIPRCILVPCGLVIPLLFTWNTANNQLIATVLMPLQPLLAKVSSVRDQ